MKIYDELILIIPGKENKAKDFYWTKQAIMRADCKAYHYLRKEEGIKIWFEDLRNKDELNDFLENTVIKIKWGIYKRAHITELMQGACKSAIEGLGFWTNDEYSLNYYIHTILTSLFMGWEDQQKLFESFAKLAKKNKEYYKKKANKNKEKGDVQSKRKTAKKKN